MVTGEKNKLTLNTSVVSLAIEEYLNKRLKSTNAIIVMDVNVDEDDGDLYHIDIKDANE